MQLNIKQFRIILLILVTSGWTISFSLMGNPWHILVDYWYFFALGLFGAIVANSTGAGGGIIFIPFFTALGFSSTTTLGTSILIQCFGMTAGSISWLTSSRVASTQSIHLKNLFQKLILFCGITCIMGVLTGQYIIKNEDTENMITIFRVFSVLFGIIMLWVVLGNKKATHTRYQLNQIDYLILFVATFIGAMVTAWISVAIGEVIAIVLLLRKFPVMVAISTGVIMSSISVLTAAPLHIYVLQTVVWEVILFAAPAAILGGTFAYLFSEKLGPTRLKLFFATWIIATGLLMSS